MADCLHLLQKTTFTLLYAFSCHWTGNKLTLMFSVFLTVSHLLCMTIERVTAVEKPLWYRVTMTRKKATQTCFGIWFFTILSAVVMFLMDQYVGKKSSGESIFVNIVTYVTNYYVVACGVVFMVSYAHIIQKVVKRNKAKLGNNQHTGRQERKTVTVCLAITALFLIFNLPFAITYLLPDARERFSFMVLQMSNCVVNSIVYFWINHSEMRDRKSSKKYRGAGKTNCM